MSPLRAFGLALGFALVAWITGCGAKMSGGDDAPLPAGMGGSGATPSNQSRPITATAPGNSPRGGSTSIDDNLDIGSCGAGTGDDEGWGGKPECGGCSTASFYVRCARHVVPLPDQNSDAIYGADEVCALAQAAFSNAGAGGAPSTNAEMALGGVGPGDACDSYVAPGRRAFDDGECIGSDSEERAGTCTIEGECCVIVEAQYCGI
jgi:hypothetical protein